MLTRLGAEAIDTGVVPDVPDAVAAIAKEPVEREITPIVTTGTIAKEALLEERMPPRPNARS